MEVSDNLKQLYKLLKEMRGENNQDLFCYYRFLVMNTERDAMFLLLKQLEKMEQRGYNFD